MDARERMRRMAEVTSQLASTRSRVCFETRASPRRARETVIADTPARRATVCIVTAAGAGLASGATASRPPVRTRVVTAERPPPAQLVS